MNENEKGFGQQGQQDGDTTGEAKNQQFAQGQDKQSGQGQNQEFAQGQDKQFGQGQNQELAQGQQQQYSEGLEQPQASGDGGPAFFPEGKPGQDDQRETGGKPGWSEKGEQGAERQNEDVEGGAGESSDKGGGRY